MHGHHGAALGARGGGGSEPSTFPGQMEPLEGGLGSQPWGGPGSPRVLSGSRRPWRWAGGTPRLWWGEPRAHMDLSVPRSCLSG